MRSLATWPPQLLHCRDIKLVVAAAQHISSHTISHHLPASFLVMSLNFKHFVGTLITLVKL
jgi:hypothetical protein